jgi:phosphate transport system protein
VRAAFAAELEQLRLQVELMGIRVDENLERMRTVLATGDAAAAATALAADDGIDAMDVSLTERCYDLLRREQPVASDLRFVVSVLRVVGELERIGDLALRVVKLQPDHHLLTASPATFDVLLTMADGALDAYRTALRAWSTQDLAVASELAVGGGRLSACEERVLTELFTLQGPDAARVAVRTVVASRSLERIADHAAVIGARLRYLLTGDPDHLATEVR